MNSVQKELVSNIQVALSKMDENQLGSWTSCMKKHIINHYGSAISDCVDGISHSNWEKILECMVTVLGIADPEVWIPEQIILFTGWSVSCIF